MTSLTDIICATTDDERKKAQDALANRNAAAPTDYEVVASFLKNCTTLDGQPLALDDQGKIVALNS